MRVVEIVAIGFVLEARIYEGGTAIFDLFLLAGFWFYLF
jgi:hypothetical protein